MPIRVTSAQLKQLRLDEPAASPAVLPGSTAPDLLPGSTAGNLSTTAAGRPRAAPGEGDRQRDLATLAAAGYTLYTCVMGAPPRHTFTHVATNTTTPARATYREALDLALELAGLREARRSR